MANHSKKTPAQFDIIESDDEAVVVAEQEVSKPKKKIVPKDIDESQYVTVRNGFHGVLVYESNRTKELFTWDSFGDDQEMQLRELKNAKSSAKAFFINNWFMFDEDWIIDYLGVGKYYKHTISIDKFDDIFKQSPDELKVTLSEMSDGQKNTLAYRARTLIEEGKIDSLKKISVIEEGLGIELVER